MNVIQVIMVLIGGVQAVSMIVIDRSLEKRGVDMGARKMVLKYEIVASLFVLILISCLLWHYS